VPPVVVVGATSAIALICAINGHQVDTLVDVVGRPERGTDDTTARAGLGWRDYEKREINEMGDIQSACHVNITCIYGYIWICGE
jgi:hypothetical protein